MYVKPFDRCRCRTPLAASRYSDCPRPSCSRVTAAAAMLAVPFDSQRPLSLKVVARRSAVYTTQNSRRRRLRCLRSPFIAAARRIYGGGSALLGGGNT